MGSLLAYLVSQVSSISFSVPHGFLRSSDVFIQYVVVRG
jgi:hypothetical protein